jgi:aspartate/methionine/tyrosine aminotransferase
MPPVSSRIRQTSTAVIDALQERYGDVPDLISLAPGSPQYKPSKAVIEATSATLSDPSISTYGDVRGWPPLRSRWLQIILGSWNQDAVQKEAVAVGVSSANDYGLELMVTAGANQGFFNLILALCDPGDEVILLLPYYFSHHCAVVMANVIPVLVPCEPETLLPDGVQAVRAAISPKTRAVVLVSPGNPSGVVIPASLVDEVVSLCQESKIWLIIDEAYKELTGSEKFYSPPSFDGVIKLYTMSKIYGMAGWRIGALVYPQHLSEQLRKVQDTIPTHAAMISQVAAYHALEVDEPLLQLRCRRNVETRSRFASMLSDVYKGVELELLYPFVEGSGAFYFFLPIAIKPSRSSKVRNLKNVIDIFVKIGNVLVAPGEAFGMPEYIRVSFATAKHDKIDDAVGGLRRALEFWFDA